MALLVPDSVAVIAFDPGRVTGVSRGVFALGSVDTVAGVWAARSKAETWECEGTIEEQVDELVNEFGDWLVERHVFDGIALPHLYVVREDFKLRTKQADLTPVELSAAFDQEWRSTHGHWVEIETQMPSNAKTYATDARLRAWGAWVRGSAHRRDANRHLLLKLSRLLG